MQAVIKTGGKQYNVSEGQLIYIEKLNAEAGESVVFDQVLAILDGEGSKIGAPLVEGASVAGTVVKNGKVEKPQTQADGISGATLTGNGVAAMLADGVNMYRPYLQKLNP